MVLPQGRKEAFYRNRKPTRLSKVVNRTWAEVFGLGLLPSFLAALETRGRRSGKLRTNAVVLTDYEGERYLVSMLGDRVDWLRNARAAGEVTLRSGRRRRYALAEVPVEDRGPILKAYYGRANGARWHFPEGFTTDTPVADFQAVAADYPVFRLVRMKRAAAVK
jgi:deazaflavin-dependent oxidoreductase (nitroreductase family)